MTHKRFFPILFLVVALLTSIPVGAQVPKATKSDPKVRLIGTWEQTGLDPKYRQVKSFTDTHFNWVVYLVADGDVVAVGGGTYTFDGKTCTEKYEYGSGNIKGFVNKSPAFAIKFVGEGYEQDGKVPNGTMIHEVYRRAK